MKKTVTIIICIIAVIAVAAGGTYTYLTSRFQYNNKNAVGNTAGNLNNGGRFCEYDGKIYFSNPYDKGKLYVMNSDCTEARALNDDTVYYLNVCGDYIYYIRNNLDSSKQSGSASGQMFGVYRADLDGQETEALSSSISGIACLYGNSLYYQYYDAKKGMSLYKAGIDGKENIQISPNAYNPASVYDGKFYFADSFNKNRISTLDAETGTVSIFYDANAYLADAADSYIYYIDLDKDYSLVRLNTSSKTLEQLYSGENGRVINYNRYGNKIFFVLEGEKSGLYRMNADGTQVEYIAEGNISSIHCTSQYTFFQYYEDSETLYRIPTTGAITKVEEITIK